MASENQTKDCPYCAESIKAQAVVCRFCGYDLRTGQPTRAASDGNQSDKVVQARSNVADGVKLGCGMFIVLPLLIILGGLLLVVFLWLMASLPR